MDGRQGWQQAPMKTGSPRLSKELPSPLLPTHTQICRVSFLFVFKGTGFQSLHLPSQRTFPICQHQRSLEEKKRALPQWDAVTGGHAAAGGHRSLSAKCLQAPRLSETNPSEGSEEGKNKSVV